MKLYRAFISAIPVVLLCVMTSTTVHGDSAQQRSAPVPSGLSGTAARIYGHCVSASDSSKQSTAHTSLEMIFGARAARAMDDSRQPRCCGQCSVDGKSGCLVNTGGRTYCSAC
jgi:hypothetical protein